MRKVTDLNEFVSLWNISHKNEYFGLKDQKKAIDKKNKRCFKRYNMYMLDDEIHFIVFNTNWNISKNLFYKHGTIPPKITLEYFKEKNKKNIENTLINTKNKPFFVLSYLLENDKEVYVINEPDEDIYKLSIEWEMEKKSFIKFLTDDEINQYNEIVKNLNGLYDMRLEKFYLKYNDKIKNIEF